jgi:hypothetical protein
VCLFKKKKKMERSARSSIKENDPLDEAMKTYGWEGDWNGFGGGRKGAWEFYFDTSSWLIVGHDRNPVYSMCPIRKSSM